MTERPPLVRQGYYRPTPSRFRLPPGHGLLRSNRSLAARSLSEIPTKKKGRKERERERRGRRRSMGLSCINYRDCAGATMITTAEWLSLGAAVRERPHARSPQRNQQVARSRKATRRLALIGIARESVGGGGTSGRGKPPLPGLRKTAASSPLASSGFATRRRPLRSQLPRPLPKARVTLIAHCDARQSACPENLPTDRRPTRVSFPR